MKPYESKRQFIARTSQRMRQSSRRKPGIFAKLCGFRPAPKIIYNCS